MNYVDVAIAAFVSGAVLSYLFAKTLVFKVEDLLKEVRDKLEAVLHKL